MIGLPGSRRLRPFSIAPHRTWANNNFREALKIAFTSGVYICMKYQIQESEGRGNYLVSAIDNEGEVCSALFSGPHAKERAEEYAEWKNSELDAPKAAPQSR